MFFTNRMQYGVDNVKKQENWFLIEGGVFPTLLMCEITEDHLSKYKLILTYYTLNLIL